MLQIFTVQNSLNIYFFSFLGGIILNNLNNSNSCCEVRVSMYLDISSMKSRTERLKKINKLIFKQALYKVPSIADDLFVYKKKKKQNSAIQKFKKGILRINILEGIKSKSLSAHFAWTLTGVVFFVKIISVFGFFFK